MDPEEIKRNLAHLRAQGAPEDVIERYMRSVGATPVEEAAAPPSMPPRPEVGHVEGLAQSAAQGASLGLSDEIAGATAAFSPSGLVKAMMTRTNPINTYTSVRDGLRDRQRSYSDAHPVAAGAAEVAGGLPLAAGSLPAALRGALKGGAALGAGAGFGHAEGDVDAQLKSTAVGAGIGGALGGAFEAVKRPVTNIGGALLTRSGLRPRTDKLGGMIEGTETIAKRFVRHQFARDGITDAGQVAAGVGPSGGQPAEIVADQGGEMVRRTLGGLQSLPGAMANKAKTVLKTRTAEQFPRITASVQRILRVPAKDADREAIALVTARRARAKPLYDAAYAKGAIDDPVLNSLLGNKWFRRAYNKAVGVAADEGITMPQVWRTTGTKEIITATGKKTVPVRERFEIPNVQALDYIKRELDGIITRGLRNTGKGGLSSTQANAIRKLRDKYVARLDELVPEYKAARAQFGTDSAAEDALEAGRNIFGRTTKLTDDEVNAMSATDRELFLVGAFRAMRDRLGGVGDHRDLTKVLNNPNVMGQLRQMARTPGEFEELQTLLQSELGMAETAAATQGSRTTPLAAMQAEIEGVNPDIFTALGTALRGKPLPALAQGGRALFSRQNTHPAGQVAEHAGEMLLAPATPKNIQNIFTPERVTQPIAARMLGMTAGAAFAPTLSDNAAGANAEAIQLRSSGMSNADLAAELSQRYTPEVVRFIVAATPQRIGQ